MGGKPRSYFTEPSEVISQYWPMTRFVTLIDAPLAQVVKKLNAYLDSGSARNAATRWTRILLPGDFRSGLEALTPCDRIGNAKTWLAVQTKNQWTALFNNGFDHNANLNSSLARTLGTTVHAIAADGNLAEPRRELLVWNCYRGTASKSIWAKSGKVFLGARDPLVSDKNNFTSEHLVEHLASLGLYPHQDSFYNNSAIMLKPPASLESPKIGLQAARKRWLKRGAI